MSGGYEVVDEGHVGGQEQFPSAWKTIRTQFHDFADLPSERYDCTESPVLQCHGLEWQIQLYPGGDTESSEDDVFISLRLWCKSCTNTNKIKAKFNIRVPSAGRVVDGAFHKFFKKDVAWGFNEYAKREDVLKPSNNYLPDGNLTVEVDIQVMLDKPPVWTPTNTISADMLAFLDAADALNTDVTFEVASEDAKECVYAHGQILAARCPTLASLAEGCDPDTPIPIGDVQADVFRMLLRFIYAGEVPSKKVIHEQAKDIIRVADRFGCTGLKLTAEAELATAGITTENAAELILFADASNCAMLKETAMEFFVKKSQAVMASEGYEQVTESPAIMREMMAAMASGNKKRPADSTDANDRDYKRMRLVELYRELDSKGLDVDGPKETLLSRLKAADEKERKKNSITISGAGFDEANGVYSKTSKLSDGLPVYQKIGNRQEERAGSICLFRCRIRTGQKKWFISYVKDDHQPGTLADFDYYSADPDGGGGGDNDNDANMPPKSGWTLDDGGLDPSPTVQKSEEDSNER